ncbi:uncharacterized protein RSE6_14532 [Rhynchosporium secalis]|uniref:Amidase domain-containing protein n=1 Tax=Rhynchosporium secalis TaxID=38038 RepID=A0A1E1MVJ0_RHYSE|nr:uncharacterized protein RSE6_14532 [Rhynchosporium secalis]
MPVRFYLAWPTRRNGPIFDETKAPRGGQCTGPYSPNMKAPGSSTGSAVITACILAFAALGTEHHVSSYLLRETESYLSRGIKTRSVLPAGLSKKPLRFRLTLLGQVLETHDQIASLEIGPQIMQQHAEMLVKSFGGIAEFELRSFRDALKTLCRAGAEIVEDTSYPAAQEYEALAYSERGMVVNADFNTRIEGHFHSFKLSCVGSRFTSVPILKRGERF